MNLDIPEKLQCIFKPKRIKVFYGGRGGGKTVSISKSLLFLGHQNRLRVLCLREFMNSIDDSVHSVLKEEISNLNMSGFYHITNSAIDGQNGTLFKYSALARNLSSLRSKHNFDVAWVEEAETISEKSLEVLIPTIRKQNAEIWFSFNPDDDFGAVYVAFVKPHLTVINSQGFYEDKDLYVVKTNLSDNPFAPETMLRESENMKKLHYKKWLHIYGGEPYADYKHSIIQPEWFEASIDAHKKLGFEPLGSKTLGFDLADTGDDKALIYRHGCLIEKAKRWDDGELPEAITMAFEKAGEWGAANMVYDDDGLGKSMKVHLSLTSQDQGLKVTPYNGNSIPENPKDIYNPDDPTRQQVTNREYFVNKRAQKFWQLRDRFQAVYNAVRKGIYTDPDKLISIASDLEDIDVLKGQLIQIHRRRGNNTRVQIQSKQDAMKEGIKSPNMADALNMCFANPLREFNAFTNLNYTSEF